MTTAQKPWLLHRNHGYYTETINTALKPWLLHWNHDYCIETISNTVVIPSILHWNHGYCTETMTTALKPWILHWNHDYCAETMTSALIQSILQWNHGYCTETMDTALFTSHGVNDCRGMSGNGVEWTGSEKLKRLSSWHQAKRAKLCPVLIHVLTSCQERAFGSYGFSGLILISASAGTPSRFV